MCDQTRAFQVNCALAMESRLRAMGIALLHLVRVQEHSISSANSSTSRCQEYLQAKERKGGSQDSRNTLVPHGTMISGSVHWSNPSWVTKGSTAGWPSACPQDLALSASKSSQEDPAAPHSAEQREWEVPQQPAGKKQEHHWDCKLGCPSTLCASKH